MKRFIVCVLLTQLAVMSNAQMTQKEKIIRTFYSGFEKHDWNTVAAVLDKDFTFTSPNNDDHIPVKVFEERCWPTNSFVKKVNFLKWAENGNELFLLVEIYTTDNKVVRNMDVYTFHEGKMKSMECFFGTGAKFPGNKE